MAATAKDRRPYIDFRALKRHAPIASVCGRYGIELRKRNGRQLIARHCPLPTHDSRKGKASVDTFTVNTEVNGFYCHHDSCRGAGANGNVIDLVMLLSNTDQYGAAQILVDWFGNPATGNGTGNPAIRSSSKSGSAEAGGAGETQSPSAAAPAAEPERNPPLAFALKGLVHDHPMILDRKISPETAKLYGIGYFPGNGSMAGRIVFTIFEDGNLVGYVGRLVEPDGARPKWLVGKGLKRSYLYGIEHCDPKYPLILGESYWLPAFMKEKGAQAAALGACDMTDAQQRRLDPFKVIWIAMDRDTRGREAAQTLRERLKAKHAVRLAYLNED